MERKEIVSREGLEEREFDIGGKKMEKILRLEKAELIKLLKKIKKEYKEYGNSFYWKCDEKSDKSNCYLIDRNFDNNWIAKIEYIKLKNMYYVFDIKKYEILRGN